MLDLSKQFSPLILELKYSKSILESSKIVGKIIEAIKTNLFRLVYEIKVCASALT